MGSTTNFLLTDNGDVAPVAGIAGTATSDSVVRTRLLEVAQLIRPFDDLFDPSIVIRVGKRDRFRRDDARAANNAAGLGRNPADAAGDAGPRRRVTNKGPSGAEQMHFEIVMRPRIESPPISLAKLISENSHQTPRQSIERIKHRPNVMKIRQVSTKTVIISSCLAISAVQSSERPKPPNSVAVEL